MFQASIQNILLGIDKIAGLEIVLEADSSYSYKLYILTEKKGKLYTSAHHTTATWEEMEQHVSTDIPIFLILNGKGIIHKAFKKVDADEDAIQIINRLIPNINVQEIYHQIFYSPQTGFLSIIRKQVLEALTKPIETKGYSIVGVNLGPFVVYDILHQLGFLTNESCYKLDRHVLELNEKSDLIGYAYDANNNAFTNISIDGDKIPADEFIAYCGAAHLYIHECIISNTIQCNYTNEEGIKQHVWKLLKKRGGIAVLALSFVLLLSNFIFYNIEFKTNNKLKAVYHTNQFKLQAIDSLSAEVKDKNRFLSDAGWLQHTQLSFYSDRIAATVLSSIKLSELSINPLDESESRKEKKIIFSHYNILIKGNCGSVADLNNWIKELQKISWLKKVTIENFKFDPKTNQSLFVIKIKLI